MARIVILLVLSVFLACGATAWFVLPWQDMLAESPMYVKTKSVEPVSPVTQQAEFDYSVWQHGPPADSNFFPIGVWLQNPSKALKYRAAGINTYVGLYQGPTEGQLAELKKARMKVICTQNGVGLNHLDDDAIIGWLQSDEPDNAQPLDEEKGYGPPILPETILSRYQEIKTNDTSRPVFLNLSQGVAWDGWIGRGTRTNHPEDYVEYLKACDIASFDIYPVAGVKPEIAGQLWYVGKGVSRLVDWTKRTKPVWNCVECTRIQNTQQVKATPHQVKAEVWMSLIHGSRGIVYFVHEWQPRFNESALLDDLEMFLAVSRINQQIHDLAPVLNSPNTQDEVKVMSSNQGVPVATMAKRMGKTLYVFAVGMRDGNTEATFACQGLKEGDSIQVLGQDTLIKAQNGTFKDHFKPWDVNIYRIDQ